MTLTAKDIVAMGYDHGAWIPQAVDYVNANDLSANEVTSYLRQVAPKPKVPLHAEPMPFSMHLSADTAEEVANVEAVTATMREVMRTPTVVSGAVMPDACPAGPMGTIPVGGVVAARNAIHPGMHSADICCSLMMTEFTDAKPADVLNAIHTVTHFGPGGRRNGERFTMSLNLLDAFRANKFLSDAKIMRAAQEHMGTQGDGNHFAFVGVSAQTGRTCLVTHHGSRGPGAGLYKLGMRLAEKTRRRLSPETAKVNAWLEADSEDGIAYWEALQLIRQWTKANHNGLHAAVAERFGKAIERRIWNEHNFVFRQDDLYFHAKGATPVAAGLMPDAADVQIVPLNMAEPVLLVRQCADGPEHGFAPHGAGRNRSRTAHKHGLVGRSDAEVFAAETADIDARFFCGRIDVSELPSAYKNAAQVRQQMEAERLAEVVDEIMPYGAIMAGDWEYDAPWKVKARAKYAAETA